MKKLCCLFVLLALGLNAQNRKTINDSVFAVGDVLKLPEFYFSMCGYGENNDSALTKVSAFINHHKKIVFEIASHTDGRGNKSSNLLLSQQRAESVFNELTHNYQVEKSQISIKGYGSSAPLVSDEEISKAKTKQEKEELHAMNRRIELRILEIK